MDKYAKHAKSVMPDTKASNSSSSYIHYSEEVNANIKPDCHHEMGREDEPSLFSDSGGVGLLRRDVNVGTR